MDLCIFDWGIFANLLSAIMTFIGAMVALWIFCQWKKQKGSEVISFESQNIFKNMEQISASLNIVFENMLNMATKNKAPIDFPEDDFINFRILNMDIIKRLDLIKFKNKDLKTITVIEGFEKNYKGFAILYHQSGKLDLNDVFKNKEKYMESVKELKEEMYKYALYKKTL